MLFAYICFCILGAPLGNQAFSLLLHYRPGHGPGRGLGRGLGAGPRAIVEKSDLFFKFRKFSEWVCL